MNITVYHCVFVLFQAYFADARCYCNQQINIKISLLVLKLKKVTNWKLEKLWKLPPITWQKKKVLKPGGHVQWHSGSLKLTEWHLSKKFVTKYKIKMMITKTTRANILKKNSYKYLNEECATILKQCVQHCSDNFQKSYEHGQLFNFRLSIPR